MFGGRVCARSPPDIWRVSVTSRWYPNRELAQTKPTSGFLRLPDLEHAGAVEKDSPTRDHLEENLKRTKGRLHR
jgi:hypothetical protein